MKYDDVKKNATPGPLSKHRGMQLGVQTVEREDGSTFDYMNIMLGAGDKCVADVVMWTAGESGGWPRVDNVLEAKANAALIVHRAKHFDALLEALKDVMAWPISDVSQFVTKIVPKCNAAIKAAETVEGI